MDAGLENDFSGHPEGLFVLFFTEMWERFSYYGMRALQVLYMTKHLLSHIEQGAEVNGRVVMSTCFQGMVRESCGFI